MPLLAVDYEAVASHLEPQLVDFDNFGDPYSFREFRNILNDHLELLMAGEPFNEDETLTEILFAQLYPGIMVTHATVSDKPGIIVRTQGKDFLLPLVMIEINFTT